MRFNSLVYLVFLCAVVAVLWALPSRARRWWLLFASYAFYASWHWPYLMLLVASAAFNQWAGSWIAAASDRKKRGAYVLAANLGLLGLFKYLDWLVGNYNSLARGFDEAWTVALPGWVLPLGISFYLFECISYVVDVVRKREKAYGFWDFQLYLAFFPHLIAGPILRVKEFFPQLTKGLGYDARKVQAGLWDLAIGSFIKVVLADSLAPSLDAAFARPVDSLGATDVWIMAAGFGLQIYFDFSAYTRIAIGSARLCGIELVENFNFPYSARNPADFWARWHMSLSRWIRDYLFYPLVGPKPTLLALCRATMISMILCGLWHGAGWTFILWGAFHGAVIAGYHVLTHSGRTAGTGKALLPGWLVLPGSVVVTFALISLGWIFFRAQSVTQAFSLVGSALMPWRFPHRGLSGTFYLHVVTLVALVWLAPVVARLGSAFAQRAIDAPIRGRMAHTLGQGVLIGVLFSLALVYLRGQTAFIYFQF